MIMSAPRAKEVLANLPEQPSIEELRKRYGTTNDDELILGRWCLKPISIACGRQVR